MEIIISSAFKRSFKKLVKIFPDLDLLLEEKLGVFQNDPFDPTLRNHKLHGDLKNLRAISIAYDLRVIYYFDKENNAVLTDIGDHKRVY